MSLNSNTWSCWFADGMCFPNRQSDLCTQTLGPLALDTVLRQFSVVSAEVSQVLGEPVCRDLYFDALDLAVSGVPGFGGRAPVCPSPRRPRRGSGAERCRSPGLGHESGREPGFTVGDGGPEAHLAGPGAARAVRRR